MNPEEMAARLWDREDEILRLRTNEAAAAHALDTVRQHLMLDLVGGEHPANTANRIRARITTMLAAKEADA